MMVVVEDVVVGTAFVVVGGGGGGLVVVAICLQLQVSQPFGPTVITFSAPSLQLH